MEDGKKDKNAKGKNVRKVGVKKMKKNMSVCLLAFCINKTQRNFTKVRYK